LVAKITAVGELWLVVKDVQNNNQSAENKNGRQQKPLPHPVLYGDAMHVLFARQSISPTTYARACMENKRKVKGMRGFGQAIE
jgi:hypothetical protein